MKIALINETSQASKSPIVFKALNSVASKFNHQVFNFGAENEQDPNQITYVQAGLMTAILLNTKTVDFVVTGCGTGQGAMLACNSFPNVLCGHITDPSDAYMFMQINNGNAVSLQYAKGFGWGAELNMEYIFTQLFSHEAGAGYPADRVIPQQNNKKILDRMKSVTHVDMLSILKTIDQDFLKKTVSSEHFKKLFTENCPNCEMKDYITNLF